MKIKTAHIVLGAPIEQAVFPSPKKNDMVIGVDEGAILCLSRDIPVTVAIGDFDSVTHEQKIKLDAVISDIHEFASEKDETDAEIALEMAVADETVDEIIVYNWSGGRIDHMLSVIYMVYQPKLENAVDRLTLLDKSNTMRFYRAGEYVLNKEEGRDYLSFLTMTTVRQLTLTGVKYPVHQVSYSYPRALISNEFLKGKCHFSFKEGLVAVIQSSDN
ncbi:thiamine diphosphokinase [Alkalibacterium kapii]|uniref:Thiamine diphosphokinase n=1 Tax=Alkalibacterium kapii TaxID=426704 RepID=A0A511AVL9_9LACT|nr:thiamine diphosphokinase [Alkalibacterium kapii]GEK91702.1 thiamine pyrophosphokinase [Alkalibacterium kapii]